ncbi:HAD family hydrolase [Edaphosphingomonas haloaromaticamans]|uniref:Phosphoglycolate phosphatase n=1 Tax=Edaphosphingomonas haloaromaticamans TaxID=653954 RepID=A0A1S1HC68_9SPHN|nr:HAD family phosphatase [Sphingomonas haloaromaticamans]OHT18903.1 Phosphoglycolate phosphatase [Sphingomonas haloaromaticamans]
MAVIFDVGHVLFDWHPRNLYARLIPDRAALEDFLARVVTFEWHSQHDAGRPFAETSAELATLHPEYAPLIAQFGPRFGEMVPGPIPGSPEIVAALDEAGVPLFALTNFSAEFWPPFRADHATLFDRFRDILVSGEEKLVKPDPEIFRRAMARFGLAPGEALFVDDRADNVAAGEAAGLIGHHFRDAPTLRADLVARGLLPG